MGRYATCTCKTNRKRWLDCLTMVRRGGEKGDFQFKMHASNKLAAMTWYDNKQISLLLTASRLIDIENEVFNIDRWHGDGVEPYLLFPIWCTNKST